jgi:hypothetical protein
MTNDTERKAFTLFVTNLHPCTTRADLQSFIEAAGFTCECILLLKYDQKTHKPLARPNAFVMLTEQGRKHQAITQLDVRTLHERQLLVRAFNHHRTGGQRTPASRPSTDAPLSEKLAWAREASR